MNKFLTGSLVLSLVWHSGQTFAQFTSDQPLNLLYEQGAREMAPDWRGLGKTHNAAIFFHHGVKKADNGRLSVWTHHEFHTAEYLEKEKTYLSSRGRMLIDCKASTLALSEQAYYSQRFARGVIIGTSSMKEVDMKEAFPDSIEERLLKTVCAPAPRKLVVKSKSVTKNEAEKETKK